MIAGNIPFWLSFFLSITYFNPWEICCKAYIFFLRYCPVIERKLAQLRVMWVIPKVNAEVKTKHWPARPTKSLQRVRLPLLNHLYLLSSLLWYGLTNMNLCVFESVTTDEYDIAYINPLLLTPTKRHIYVFDHIRIVTKWQWVKIR